VCLPALTMFTGMSSTQAEKGAFAFNGLVIAAFILCCFSGFLTVDGISRERREGTLGLLFLTRVRVLDVLLGNFGAAGLAGLCALAAGVPVLIVPILTGGVSGGEAVRKVLALFDTMILSLAAGLWASARGRGWWSCARSAALVLLVVVFGPLLLGALFPRFSPLYVSWPGPLSALAAADDITYRKSAGAYWISIVVIHAISWLLVLGAGVRLRRALREEDESPPRYASLAAGRKARPEFMFADIKITFRGLKPLAEGEAPLAWLMRRRRGVRIVVWAGALLGAPFYIGLLFPRLLGRGMWGYYSMWGIHLAFTIVQGGLFAWVASRFFVESRRGGELELLMTTPEGAANIAASQWQWLKNVFWWPTVALAAPSVVVLLLGNLLYQRWDGHTLYALSSQVISCVSTIAGIVALVWVGMWCGWTERSQARAIVRTVILAKAAPYLIGMFGPFVIRRIVPIGFYATPPFSASPFLFAHVLVLEIPQIVLLLFYLYLFRWARRQLQAQLGHPSPKSGLDSLLNSIYQPG
jgi:hypothetical protein